MNDFKPIPTRQFLWMTLFTAILALALFSQVLAEPNHTRNDVGTTQNTYTSGNNLQPTQPIEGSQIHVTSKSQTLRYYLMVSLSSAITTAIIAIWIAFAFVYYFNSKDIKEFVNNAFQLNGFEGSFRSHGKSMNFTTSDQSLPSTFVISGFQKLRVTFVLPLKEGLDPLEFGLRKEFDHATTVCDLELLPLKLRVVAEYYNALQT